jgi:AraC family transcriptional regulator, transcriptional activator FtrA
MLRTVAAVLIDRLARFELAVICEVFGIDRTEDGVPPSSSAPAGNGPVPRCARRFPAWP